MGDDRHHSNPLYGFFLESVRQALGANFGEADDPAVEAYLANLLTTFIHSEAIFGIRNMEGARIESISEMLAEGDVRMKAPNFDREREVHRHIGDFLLFWSGVFPEMLQQLHGFHTNQPESEAVRLGQFSYSIVSSFDHAPYGVEAPTFTRLAKDFEAYQHSLRLVRASFEGFRRQGWSDGFSG